MLKLLICLIVSVNVFAQESNIVNLISKINTDSNSIFKLTEVVMQSQQDLFSLPSGEEENYNTEFSKLETTLSQKYASDFSSHGWHGWLSLQRIVWQDETFLCLISTEVGFKTLLNRAKLGKERKLGPLPLTLSSALLYGLKSQLPTYMVTASPNWKNKPIIPGVTWSSLGDMRISPSAVEPIREVKVSMLEKLSEALKNMKKVLLETNPTDTTPSLFLTKMFTLKSNELLTAFNNIINTQDKASILVAGSAGGSTSLRRMAGQSDEVMMEYKKILLHHKNMHENVLSYGLVSHALDAKHFAAKLYMANSDRTGNIDAFDQFMNSYRNKQMTDKALVLVKTRLQQIFMIILEKKSKLGMTESQLVSLL